MAPHLTSSDAPAHAQALPQQVPPPGSDGLEHIASYPDLVTALGADAAASGILNDINFVAAVVNSDNSSAAIDANININFVAAVVNSDNSSAAIIGNSSSDQFGFAEGRTDGSPGSANTAPTAVADAGGATEDGGPVRLDVLANDIDLDQGDSLVAVEETGTVGALRIGPDGRVVYTPGDAFQELNGGQSAIDNFIYTIEDQAGARSTATVTMTVAGVDEPPLVLPLDAAASDFLL
jgi:VCBS repeat-containing protein